MHTHPLLPSTLAGCRRLCVPFLPTRGIVPRGGDSRQQTPAFGGGGSEAEWRPCGGGSCSSSSPSSRTKPPSAVSPHTAASSTPPSPSLPPPPPPPPRPPPPSPSPNLLARGSGSLLPTSARAAVADARTAAARAAGFDSSSSTLLHGVAAPWAHWTTTPADDVVLMLVGANVAVYGLWRLADPKFRLSPYMVYLDMYLGGQLHSLLTRALSHVDQRFMVNHFMVSMDNFKSFRLHTLLTSAFSHMDANHLFHNMIGLYFFGSSIGRMFGPGFLSLLYVQGALFGSAFYLAEKFLLAPRNQGFGGWNTPALGASAAVNATILLDIFLHPTKTLYLHFFIPLPAALAGAYLIGADLWRVKKGSRVSGSAHLGGAFVAAYWFAGLKGWI